VEECAADVQIVSPSKLKQDLRLSTELESVDFGLDKKFERTTHQRIAMTFSVAGVRIVITEDTSSSVAMRVDSSDEDDEEEEEQAAPRVTRCFIKSANIKGISVNHEFSLHEVCFFVIHLDSLEHCRITEGGKDLLAGVEKPCVVVEYMDSDEFVDSHLSVIASYLRVQPSTLKLPGIKAYKPETYYAYMEQERQLDAKNQDIYAQFPAPELGAESESRNSNGMSIGGKFNRVAVQRGDLFRLGEGEWLNDTLIDFYMKRLELVLVPKHKRENDFFFFNSLLWHRLGKFDLAQTPAERHKRMERWTKDVNIFDKKWIVIPINKSLHWSLVVATFVEESELKNTHPKHTAGRSSSKPKGSLIQKAKDSIKSGLFYLSSALSPSPSLSQTQTQPTPATPTADSDSDDIQIVEKKKLVPCLLWFDSLYSHTHSFRCSRSLILYLKMEWSKKLEKHPEMADTAEVQWGKWRIYEVDVTKQDNYCDCGVYTLKFAENFIRNPFPDLRPESLEMRMPRRDIAQLRSQIQSHIHTLHKEQNAH
jgi:hypothetical protein